MHGGCVVPLGEEFADRVLEDDSYLRWFVVDTEGEGGRRVVVARRTRAQARRDLSVLR